MSIVVAYLEHPDEEVRSHRRIYLPRPADTLTEEQRSYIQFCPEVVEYLQGYLQNIDALAQSVVFSHSVELYKREDAEWLDIADLVEPHIRYALELSISMQAFWEETFGSSQIVVE